MSSPLPPPTDPIHMPPLPPHHSLILVAGMPSGGTSVAAGLLHHLGVDMGRIERGVAPGPRRYEGFECLDCWEDGIQGAYDPARTEDFMTSVSAYLQTRLQTADHPYGVKHNPLVWLGMFDGIDTLPIRILHIHRPLDEVMVSDRRYRGDDLHRAARLGMATLALARLLEQITPTLSLEFRHVLADPMGSTEAIVDHFELTPSTSQRAEAIRFVDPKLRNVG